MQVKNKPRDRELKHAFILGSIANSDSQRYIQLTLSQGKKEKGDEVKD
jgi:hypothetical protein